MNLDTSSSCYLISVMTLNIFVFRSYWLIITLLTSPIEQKLVWKKHNVEKGACVNMPIVFSL